MVFGFWFFRLEKLLFGKQVLGRLGMGQEGQKGRKGQVGR
jgi:hypothetical protein